MIALLAGCVEAPPADPPRFVLVEDAFEGDPVPANADVFAVVQADLEGDGDLDLLQHRHLLAPLELFENLGDGTFVQLNRKGSDETGLWDNPGIPDLFARDVPHRGPGVYVWHDLARGASWEFRVVPGDRPTRVRIAPSTPVEAVAGLGRRHAAALRAAALPEGVVLRFDGPTRFSLRSDYIGAELSVELVSGGVPLYVGADATEVEGPRSLWKPDPHGVAWVDAAGGPEPDLFVTRGALQGTLAPPQPPKFDALFVREDRAFRLARTFPGYTRGRQVMWIDVDEDGVDELFVADTTTPDQVLDPAEGWSDLAPALGLDLVGAEAVAWLDVDADGHLELVWARGVDLGVSERVDDRWYERDPAFLGLAWDPAEPTGGVFDPGALRTVDLDRDGDLDLLLLDVVGGAIRAFRVDAGRFTDVTGEVGLASARMSEVLVADVDDDGWPDLVGGGSRLLWRGGPGGFAPLDLGLDLGDRIAVADLDGDGRQDLVWADREGRPLARNATAGERPEVRVSPAVPRGTRVVARHASGARVAQSWGQATATRFCQGDAPLWFGSPPEDPVVALSAWCPGDPAPGPEVPPHRDPPCR